MRWAMASGILLHGLIHLLGFVRSAGLADLPQLTQDISPRMGLVWLGAGLGLTSSAVLLLLAPRFWWAVALPAVLLSQGAIFSAWSDAKVGTLANLVVLALAVYGLAAQGPMSLRAEYRRATTVGPEERVVTDVVTDDDLVGLPAPVRSWVHRAGAVGQPVVTHFRAAWAGRIRADPADPWMDFTAEQVNRIDAPERFFFMDARRGRFPVDVLHVFRNGSASMRVRLLSLLPLVRATGPELTRAETVTLFNDLAILAPGALVDPGIRWEAIGPREARGHYTAGGNTVSAVLTFNEAGELIDFVSDDRLVASSDGTAFTRQRWSTPLSDYRGVGRWHVAHHGEGWWHPADAAPYAYVELNLTELEINPPR